MGLVTFIIFGGLVGWVASILVGKNAEQGIIGNIVVGIAGSFLGGLIANIIGGRGITGFNISSFIVALFGALITLFVVHKIT